MTGILQFLLALGVLIAFAKAMGYLTLRLNQPAVLGELLAGVIIGPSLINLLGIHSIFPDGEQITHTIIELAEIGVLLLMFMAGMEVEPKSMMSVGRAAVFTGLLGVVVPLIVITPAVTLFGYSFEKSLFIGILLASMSTSITAQVMMEMGVLRQKAGLTLLGAALVDDAIVILLLSLFIAINPGGVVLIAEARPIGEVLLRIAGFLVIGTLVSWYALPRIANIISRLRISEGPLTFAIVSTLLLSFAAEYFGGIAVITGAFLAGVCLRQARHSVVEEIERGLHSINYSFFVPLFFISIGLQANLRLLTVELLPFALVITALAIITKVVGAGAGAMTGGLNRKNALRIGVGMISRGEVGLIIAAIGVNSGVLLPEVFTVVIFVVLVTTIITPPLVRWSFANGDETPTPQVKPPVTVSN